MDASDESSDAHAADDRDRRTDLWERGADERERLSDEREALAAEREALADERDRLADRPDRALDQRELDLLEHEDPSGPEGRRSEVAAAEGVVRRAEAAARRADAEVQRARRAAARAIGRAERREAEQARRDAAGLAGLVEGDDADWAADRRDFVAVERERLAVERERVADERDATADLRDRVADAREREALDREASLGSSQVSGRTGSDVLGATDRDDARRHNRRRREDAAAARRDAAERRSFAADDWGPREFGPRLTAMFADVALQLFGGEDLDEALPHLLALSVAAVPGCDRAAITVVEGGRPLHTVASDDVARELELEQWSGATGPAPAVLADGEDVSVRALDDAARWPRLAAAAARLGVGSAASHCLMLRASDGWVPVGTLTLYGAGTDSFDEDDLGTLSLVGSYAAVAIALSDQRADLDRREAALHRALSTRDVIGQAKGILMERRHLSAGDAFDVLRHTSQRLNRRLADVAEHLSRTGELP